MAWVRKMPSKRWRAEWRDPDRRQRSKTFGRKQDAERHLVGVQAAMLAGSYVNPSASKIALRGFWPRFLDASPHLRPSTREGYEGLWRRHIDSRLGARPIGSITRLDVEAFVAGLSAQGVGAATVGAAHRLLRRVLSAPEDAGLLARNPARGVRTPKPDREEMRFLTADEVHRVAEAILPRYRALILLLAYGGLRIGEAAALRVQNVDVLRRRVQITESATEVAGKLVFGQPKTRQSRRAVPVPRVVANALAEHLAAFPPGPDGLVFVGEGGGPLHRTTFRRRAFATALRAARIAEPWPRVHDLRHTAAALMIEAGVHAKAIQDQLGHSSITVTMDRYGHLMASLADDMTDRLDSIHEAAVAARAAYLPPEEGPNVVPLPVAQSE